MENKYLEKLTSVGLIEKDKILNLSIIENEFLSKINYPIIPSNEFLKKYEVNSIWKIFYLKNEFFIERLSIDELAYLKEKYKEKSIDVEFIKSTYSKITKYYDNYPDNYYVHYPNTYEDTYVMNNSLFLIILVDIFQNKIDDFQEFYLDTINKLDKLQDEIKQRAKDISLEIIYMIN